jgi:hypothetical protein
MERRERGDVVGARPVEAERPAQEDGPVAPGQIELGVRLLVQRRRKSERCGLVAAKLEHVRRNVGAIHVEPVREVPEQESSQAAPRSSAGCPRSTMTPR